MKITELLDRPIAFHRVFVTLTGSVKAAIMLSQAVYWQPRAKQADGWWYKTADEWEEETGLTRHEQDQARKDCAKYLKSDLRGVPATLYWHIDEDALQADLFGENDKSSLPESGKLDARKQSNINKNTETTTESKNGGKNLLSNMPLEWQLLHGQSVDQAALDKQRIEKEACDNFERELGFGPLDWYTKTEWEKLRRFVVKQYTEDHHVFVDFAAWRKEKGKYSGWSNAKIRTNPQIFIDGALPEFRAAAMYSKSEFSPEEVIW